MISKNSHDGSNEHNKNLTGLFFLLLNAHITVGNINKVIGHAVRNEDSKYDPGGAP